jgi:hypothetical protein
VLDPPRQGDHHHPEETTIPMTDHYCNRSDCPLSFDDLAEALRAQARGAYAPEASVELLIDHGTWLRRNDFIRRVDLQPTFDHCALMASVDWDAVHAANLVASSSEEQILAIASELAGHDTGQPLDQLLCGLDETNVLRVVRAVVHAAGKQDLRLL